MDNIKSNLTGSVPENSARTESSFELSSVFEEMKNGIDIQPLDDVKESELIAFEENIQTQAENEEEELPENKKKRLKKRIIKICSLALVIIAVLVGAYAAIAHFNDYSHGAVAIYRKGTDCEIILDNDRTITLENVADARLSGDGKRVVYSQDTSSKTGAYDLMIIELTKRRSVKSKGTMAVSGIETSWTTDENCNYIYFSKTEENSQKYFAYSPDKKETYSVAYAASEVFFPPTGDVVYFTKNDDDKTQLYKIKIGEKAEIVENISDVRCFTSNQVQEIFYTVETDGEKYDLYKITSGGAPVKIASSISEVYLDDYEVGGNLYYFEKLSSYFNWNNFVTDRYSEADSVMKKPDKGDFLKSKGFILKSTYVDENAYNKAMQEYNKKVLRDKIREKLGEIDYGVSVTKEYKIKVYDGERSKELATGVKMDNLLAYAVSGAPRIIYKNAGIESAQKTDMSTLFKIANQNGVDAAVDYVVDKLKKGYEISNGYMYSYYNGNNVIEYDFSPEYNIGDATFCIGEKDSIFAAVKTDELHYKLYCSQVKDGKVIKEVEVAENVTSFKIKSDKLYYNVATKDGGNNLYVCRQDATHELICENNVQFFATKSGAVLAMKAAENTETLQKVDLVIYKDGKAEVIDRNVSYKHMSIGEEEFAYIKDYVSPAATDTEIKPGGELVLYKEGKKKSLSENVTEIIDINIK